MMSCTGVSSEEAPLTEVSVLGCPENMEQVIGAGTSLMMGWTEPTAEDSNGIPVLVLEQSHNPEGSFVVGTIEVSYLFEDAVGNVGSCIFMLTVKPNPDAPTILACPSDFTETTEVAASSVMVSWTEPTAEDKMNNPITTFEQSHSPGDTFDLDLTTVTYTFTDSDGFVNHCIFTVMVEQPPSTGVILVEACPSDIEEFGLSSVMVNWTEPTAEDSNKNSVSFSYRSHSPGTIFTEGLSEVSYTFTDSEGNMNSCSFMLKINARNMKVYEFYLRNDAEPNSAGSMGNAFLIEQNEDLEMLATLVSDNTTYDLSGTATAYAGAYYRLESSLDLSAGYMHTPIGDCKTDVSGNGWPCKDNDDLPFKGNFDGNGKTLTGLSYSSSGPAIGFFRLISNATLSNLTIENSSITNTSTSFSNGTGILVGLAHGKSVISNVTIRGGNVKSSAYRVGGLVGYQWDSSIMSSSFDGIVMGAKNNIGGLVGEASSGSSISGSTASGTVSGGARVGGLVGQQTTGTTIISGSYATATVSATSIYIGGLVGHQNGGSVTDSYATGSVSGNRDVGGLVGYQASSHITNSYAVGLVEAISGAGGLVGYRSSGSTTVSYWDTTTTGQSSSGSGTGETTAVLQVVGGAGSIYATWNSPSWIFTAGEYPALVR